MGGCKLQCCSKDSARKILDYLTSDSRRLNAIENLRTQQRDLYMKASFCSCLLLKQVRSEELVGGAIRVTMGT